MIVGRLDPMDRLNKNRYSRAASTRLTWNALFVPLAFVLALLLLTFTAIPLPLRVLAPFLLVLVIPGFRRGARTWLIAVSTFTAVQCLVGAGYVWYTGDGTLLTACYPALREYVIGLIVIAALNGRSFNIVMLFVAIWVVLQGIAIISEMAGFKFSSLVPFPIVAAEYAGSVEEHFGGGRYGGFTFEAGVLGGIASIFLQLIILSGYMIFRNRPRLSPRILQLSLIALCLAGVLTLALTKSGTFTLILASITLFGVAAFSGDLRSAVVALAGMGVAALIVFIAVASIPAASNYVEQETERVTAYIKAGDTTDIADSGLATRLECARLAFVGVGDYPFGLGYDGLKKYLGKHLDNEKMTPEMKHDFALDAFGLKGYLFNILATSGVLGVLLMLWMIFASSAPFLKLGQRRSLAVSASIAAGLIALSMSAELMPFVGLCGLIYSAGMALKRERLGNAQPQQANLSRRPAMRPEVKVPDETDNV